MAGLQQIRTVAIREEGKKRRRISRRTQRHPERAAEVEVVGVASHPSPLAMQGGGLIRVWAAEKILYGGN
ncbi:hypothetical protein GUJ93_ZPchr0006g44579 [Zizania palustris]|uniref:Uncharacterized protein n=1 Tax=Zizania palustris TaxID=103762 RepID=A0A8J5VNR2_ZIZPA|nr:hypothetical protein GUJ93_ZPchr0006g44579 [Zizania palustris]